MPCPAVDRGGVIPGSGDPVWKQLPPNGLITAGDISAVQQQYFMANPGGCPPAFPAQFSYDEENRLTSRTDGGTTTTYTYDGQGTLVRKAVTGGTAPGTTHYVGDIYEQKGTAVTKYYWFGGRRVAMRQDGTLNYLLADHLGSTTMALDSAGNAVPNSSEKYYPFGRQRSTNAVSTDKQFTGHQREGAQYFMKARFYNTGAGRFLQPDGIVPDYMNPQALNRYSYVMNNPLRYVDPFGRCGYDPNNPGLGNFMGICAYQQTAVGAWDYSPISLHLGQVGGGGGGTWSDQPLLPDEYFGGTTSWEGSARINPWVAGAILASAACIHYDCLGTSADGIRAAACSIPFLTCSSEKERGSALGPWGPEAAVQNDRLKRAVEELYREEDAGPGGSAGVLRREREYGYPERHRQKVSDQAKNIERILEQEALSDSDREVAEAIQDDLQDALKVDDD